MYIFTTFFPYSISRTQFLWGIVIGALSSIPLVFHDNFFLWEILWNVFLALSVNGFTQISSSLIVLFLSIFFLYFILWYSFQEYKYRFTSVYLKSLIVVFLLIVLSSWAILIFQNVFLVSVEGVSVSYGWLVSFISVGSIISYYMVIALLEEGNKYISWLSFSGRWNYFQVLQKYLSMTACIALWFAFFENILYAYFYVNQSGINGSLLSLVFFRSIFTIILHLMSSILFALWFWWILHAEWWLRKYSLLSLFFLTSLWLISHVIFDSVLSFGYIGVVFFYVFLIYILLSYITMRTDSLPDNSEFQ